MAIPGYSASQAPDDVIRWVDERVYGNYASKMVDLAEYLGVRVEDLDSQMKELEKRCQEIDMVQYLNEDGKLDWGKFRPAPGQFSDLSKLLMFGDPSMAGPDWSLSAVGFVDGQIAIFFGEYAISYILQTSTVAPAELTRPKLYFTGSSGFGWSDVDSGDSMAGSTPVSTPTFVATFMTIYGETQPSDPLTFPRLVYWESVTLEVEDPPSYAGSVRYYRLFGDTYRLVSEVKIK